MAIALSDRDRRLLIGAGLVAVVAAILLLVDVPLYTGGRRLAASVAEERQRLATIASMGREYVAVKAEVDDIRATAYSGGGASLSGLDGIVTRLGLKKKLASMKATTRPMAEGLKAVKAELSLERVSLPDVSTLIAALESDGHAIAIERVALKAAYDDPAAFTLTLIVNTVERE